MKPLPIAQRRVINEVARGGGARRGRLTASYDALVRAGLIEYGHDDDLGFSVWRLTDAALHRFLSPTELETLAKQRFVSQSLRSAAPPLTVPPTQTSSAPAGTTRRRSTMPLTDRQIAVATAVHAGAKTAGEARKHPDVEKLGLGPGDTLGVLRGLEKRDIVKLSQATKSAPVTVKYTSKTKPSDLRKADEAARAAKVAAAKEAKAKAAPKKAPAKKAPAAAKGKATTKKAAPPKAKTTTAKAATVTPIDAKTKAAARAATVAKDATPATPAPATA